MIVRVLADIELPKDTVYLTRGFGQKKRWVPQANISTAIKQLEEMQKARSD
jgi:hypothetical protein